MRNSDDPMHIDNVRAGRAADGAERDMFRDIAREIDGPPPPGVGTLLKRALVATRSPRRPSAPVVGYDRVTSVPLCEHGDDAEACQLAHPTPTRPNSEETPIVRVDRIRRYYDAGQCSREVAIREICIAMNDGVTETGAADLLDDKRMPSDAEPTCCGDPMIHNSFTGQYECAVAYLALHDAGIDPYACAVEDLDTHQQAHHIHWMESRRPDGQQDDANTAPSLSPDGGDSDAR